MRRLVLGVSILSVAVLTATATSCATYRADLDRARHHYEENQYEAALALFRVLEPDLDSLSPAEQAQYAYLRGMTDFRLASISQSGSNVKDPKRDFRDNARHWLAVSLSIDKNMPGGLGDSEKQRLTETLTDLNRDVYGGADGEDADAGAPSKGAKAAKDPAP